MRKKLGFLAVMVLVIGAGAYVAADDFGDDGGYSSKWVKLQFGPIPFAFPNSQGRVRAGRGTP